MDGIVTTVSSTRVLVPYVIGVWFGCISVVLTTVRESATHDSKENKHAHAGNRLFLQVFSARRVVVELMHQQSVKVYLHNVYNGNIQQNPLCAESCVTKDLPISPRFSPTIFYRDANSVLLSTPLYSSSSRLYAQNPVFEIAHQESVKVYDINLQKTV